LPEPRLPLREHVRGALPGKAHAAAGHPSNMRARARAWNGSL